ncbi:thialysine N-epsilon-acetyltransferase-like [Culicoides brevitarsis]|uniref:thialysine N-epsilon-acetyltransferase-like n=1 Tax=Culicoides brevitarsis TaxID=469753 RepID=UPI00307BB05C
MNIKFTVRKTEAADLQDILDMIQELADYEEMPSGPKLKREDLLRDGAFEDNSLYKFFHSFVAEEIASDDNHTKSKIIGYSIAFFSYSKILGKTYFLEDIYVKNEYRKLGVGGMLFKENVNFALAEGCKQLNLHVLDWNNPAINFYKKLHAEDLTTEKGVQFVRFDKNRMENLMKMK